MAGLEFRQLHITMDNMNGKQSTDGIRNGCKG